MEISKRSQNFATRNEVNEADASRIRWRRIVNVNATTEIGSLVFRGPKHFKLAMASGNTSLIATFSSFFLFPFVVYSMNRCAVSEINLMHVQGGSKIVAFDFKENTSIVLRR